MVGRNMSAAVLLLVAFGAGACGGAARNCLVIPAQIELVQERREAALADLENTARQVDRMAQSIERVQVRHETLQQEVALLDSLFSVSPEGK